MRSITPLKGALKRTFFEESVPPYEEILIHLENLKGEKPVEKERPKNSSTPR
jgi:hypothetical protein